MGNCTGCTGPQRKNVKVSRLQQGSPIKNRLSTGNSKSFYPSDQNYSFANREDKYVQQKRNSQQLNFLGALVNNSLKKQPRAGSMSMSLKKQQQFDSNNVLSTILKNHIILHPDNPQMNPQRQQQSSSLFMQRQKQNMKASNSNNNFYSPVQNLMENTSSKKQFNYAQSQFKKNVNTNSNNFAESKYQLFQPPQSTINQKYQSKSIDFRIGQSDIRGGVSEQYGNNSMEKQMNALDKLDLSQIQLNKQSSAQKFYESEYKQSNSMMPHKKYSRSNYNLMVIEQLLNQHNGSRTPNQVKVARKNNGQDIRYDHLQDLSNQIQHIQIPNFNNYLSQLKQIVQN